MFVLRIIIIINQKVKQDAAEAHLVLLFCMYLVIEMPD